MLPPAPTDHRHSDERALLHALRNGDALALAEAYHRTIAGAHACARRLLPDPREVEALLTQVYEELWTSGPDLDESPEGWVRRRCFALATAHLQQEGRAAASPSTAGLLPDLPAPLVRHLDASERALAQLPERDRLALLRAHDAGVPASQQRAWAIVDADSAASPREALTAALLQLAGPDPAAPPDRGDPDGGDPDCGDPDNPDDSPRQQCDEPHLADWVLGLLDVGEAAQVATAVDRRPECAAVARALRRGRRRLEGLPPTPDMGQRIIAAVLSRGYARAVSEPAAPAHVDEGATSRTTDAAPGESDTEDLTGLPDVLAARGADAEADAAPPAGDEQPAGDEAVGGATAVAADPDPLIPAAAGPAAEPAERDDSSRLGAARRAARTILGLLLLVVGAVIGLYVGQAIVATL